jgi:hypothetical protein
MKIPNPEYSVVEEATEVADKKLYQDYLALQEIVMGLDGQDLEFTLKVVAEANKTAKMLGGEEAEPYIFHVIKTPTGKIEVVRGELL